MCIRDSFKSKQGKNFDAIVAFDGEYNTTFVFPVKGDNSIETLALFALEPFEQLGMPFGEQVFDCLLYTS